MEGKAINQEEPALYIEARGLVSRYRANVIFLAPGRCGNIVQV